MDEVRGGYRGGFNARKKRVAHLSAFAAALCVGGQSARKGVVENQ
jgi:hypothetical protein